MKKLYPLPLILLTLASCSSAPKPPAEDDPLAFTYEPELGVVIAKSDFMGRHYATDTDGTVSDCPGNVGVGVVVETSLNDSAYIFDKNQQPCQAADILFDGSLDKHARAASPSVDIIFNDKYGKLAPKHTIEKTADLSTVLSDAKEGYTVNSDLAEKQYDQMGQLKVDYNKLQSEKVNNTQQAAFTAMLKQDIAKQEAEALAKARAVARESIEHFQNNIEKENQHLIAKNDIVEKQKQQVADQLISKTEQLTELQSELSTLKAAKEIQTNNYEEKVALLEKRVEEFAQLSLELKRQNELLALSAKQANQFVAKDLTAAENDADNARYAAMMKLAENIEVDEKLAKALEVSQNKALQRKAQRLQTQADTLAYHATADKVFNKDMEKVYQDLQNNMQPAFEGKIARVVGVDINQEPTLADVQLLLAEQNKSVNEMLLEILADVQPMLGTWKIDWKLASHNLQIKDEKWNVTAETTLYDFFDYIKQRVNEIHGVELKIEQYPETRKLVITDSF
tara:strand:+ start:332 stop:1861 length:1530 start_codon:yes stop_codon:yes gene_type:complete